MTMYDEYKDAVERIHDMLVARATGGFADESEYRELRSYVLETDDLAERAPEWLRRMRTLDTWWANIKPLYGTYAERQRYVSTEFEPLFEYIESLPHDRPKAPPPKAKPPQSTTHRPSPEEVKKANDEMTAFMTRMMGISEKQPQQAAAPPAQTQTPSPQPASRLGPPRVFIVHGHDTNRREAVARFVERMGFVAVILADQPDQGRTIIEKFEAHTDVDYAIVLMTPDDFGAKRGGTPAKPRARQNVVFEHGFFVGLLGRRKVVGLVVDTVETPSDLSGVLYVRWDEADAWKGRIAREMKAAGLPVDMNKV